MCSQSGLGIARPNSRDVRFVEPPMRLITAAPRRSAVDPRLIAFAIVSIAIAFLVLPRVSALPLSADPVRPNVTPAATARPLPTSETIGTAGPQATPFATAEPSSAPMASPGSSLSPRETIPTGAAPADRTSPTGAAPQQGSGYGPNGPAALDQVGPRQIDSDPAPGKVILPKGSMGR